MDPTRSNPNPADSVRDKINFFSGVARQHEAVSHVLERFSQHTDSDSTDATDDAYILDQISRLGEGESELADTQDSHRQSDSQSSISETSNKRPRWNHIVLDYDQLLRPSDIVKTNVNVLSHPTGEYVSTNTLALIGHSKKLGATSGLTLTNELKLRGGLVRSRHNSIHNGDIAPPGTSPLPRQAVSLDDLPDPYNFPIDLNQSIPPINEDLPDPPAPAPHTVEGDILQIKRYLTILPELLKSRNQLVTRTIKHKAAIPPRKPSPNSFLQMDSSSSDDDLIFEKDSRGQTQLKEGSIRALVKRCTDGGSDGSKMAGVLFLTHPFFLTSAELFSLFDERYNDSTLEFTENMINLMDVDDHPPLQHSRRTVAITKNASSKLPSQLNATTLLRQSSDNSLVRLQSLAPMSRGTLLSPTANPSFNPFSRNVSSRLLSSPFTSSPSKAIETRPIKPFIEESQIQTRPISQSFKYPIRPTYLTPSTPPSPPLDPLSSDLFSRPTLSLLPSSSQSPLTEPSTTTRTSLPGFTSNLNTSSDSSTSNTIHLSEKPHSLQDSTQSNLQTYQLSPTPTSESLHTPTAPSSISTSEEQEQNTPHSTDSDSSDSDRPIPALPSLNAPEPPSLDFPGSSSPLIRSSVESPDFEVPTTNITRQTSTSPESLSIKESSQSLSDGSRFSGNITAKEHVEKMLFKKHVIFLRIQQWVKTHPNHFATNTMSQLLIEFLKKVASDGMTQYVRSISNALRSFLREQIRFSQTQGAPPPIVDSSWPSHAIVKALKKREEKNKKMEKVKKKEKKKEEEHEEASHLGDSSSQTEELFKVDSGLKQSKEMSHPERKKKRIVLVSLHQISLEELARQMTLVECQLYMTILNEEFVDCAWMSTESSKSSPNLKAMIMRFNRVSLWVSLCCLNKKTPKERAKQIMFWISLAEECERLQNYETVMQVMTGLTRHCVRRLKQTWPLISTTKKESFDRLQKLTDTTGKNRALRERLRSISPPFIPFFGMYLTDLVYINEAPTFIEDRLNYTKLRMEGMVIQEIKKASQMPYSFYVVQEMWPFLENLPIVDEETLLEMSFQNEPKQPV
ncbi:putative Ras-specific guanine nucleotide-releasing factor 1 [Blattamonas nauphoetae]|uniref:Ras-specific guanine nucleotide-releasing factor 1 n=1 Tax=Blattamonas nauphoetae TaxID=2049346 RepID=A0ABQ9YF63_9EUKA|nr:putative Ras-specific guanine nucleotide-releasing factor 1 [Blattamonas nauphoetae]